MIIIFTLISKLSFSQEQHLYYIKNDGKYVNNLDSADFIRIVGEPDSGSTLFNVLEKYKNGKNKSIGKSSKIDPPNYQGQRLTFFINGKKEALENYKDNELIGLKYEFYPNGKPYLVKDFPMDDKQNNQLLDKYSFNECYDSLGMLQVVKGNGYAKVFDNNFKYIYEEGKVKNGKRDSIWKGEDKSLNLKFVENYKDGLLLTGTGTDDKGVVISYSISRFASPEFKGGLNRFYNFLGNNIEYPDDARRDYIQGTVVLQFVVEKDGTVTDVELKKSVSPSINAEALRVLRKSRKWLPGTEFGRPVRCSYTVPISFSFK